MHTIPGITVREEARNFPENSEEGLFVIFCQAIFSTIGCPHVGIPLEMNPFFLKEAAKFSERSPGLEQELCRDLAAAGHNAVQATPLN